MRAKLQGFGMGLLDTPGPGAYKPTSYTMQSFPTIGFKTEARGNETKNENPAPNEYKPSFSQVRESFAEVKFGKAERAQSKCQDMPGPGEYDTKGLHEENIKANYGATLSSRYQKLEFNKDTPGPGEYQPRVELVKIRPASCRYIGCKCLGSEKKKDRRKFPQFLSSLGRVSMTGAYRTEILWESLIKIIGSMVRNLS